MARGHGRSRFNGWVAESATHLAAAREELDGMCGDDPNFDRTLARAIGFGGDVMGLMMRIDRASSSTRSAAARIMARCTVPQPETEGAMQ
jgi:hypothetical protein